MTYHKHSYEKRYRIVRGKRVTYTDDFGAAMTALDLGHEVTEGYADEEDGDGGTWITRRTTGPLTRIAERGASR